MGAHDAGISLIPRFGCSSNDGLPARVSEDKGCLPHGKNAAALRRDPLMQAIAPSKTAIRWGQLDGAFFRRELISESANILFRAGAQVADDCAHLYGLALHKRPTQARDQACRCRRGKAWPARRLFLYGEASPTRRSRAPGAHR